MIEGFPGVGAAARGGLAIDHFYFQGTTRIEQRTTILPEAQRQLCGSTIDSPFQIDHLDLGRTAHIGHAGRRMGGLFQLGDKTIAPQPLGQGPRLLDRGAGGWSTYGPGPPRGKRIEQEQECKKAKKYFAINLP